MIEAALTLIGRNWKLVFAGVLVVSNVVSCRSYLSERDEYKTYRAGVGVYAKAQEDHNTEMLAERDRITKETTDGWKAAVDYLRTRPVGVLSRACAGQMSGLSVPAAGADDAAQGPVLTPARIEEDASSDVLQLNMLQDWLTSQRKVK